MNSNVGFFVVEQLVRRVDRAGMSATGREGLTRGICLSLPRYELPAHHKEVDNRLVCARCGAESPPDAAGWRAYLDDDGQAVTFCRYEPVP